jgi:hypothetical protein
MTEVQDAPTMTEERIAQTLDRIADGFSHMARSPVLHSPAEHGLDFSDVTFPSRDGVALEGWFIPAAGSGKLVIANHPMASPGPACRPTWSRGTRRGRRAGTGSRSTSSPTTRSSTTPGTTCWPTTCATTA